MGYSLFNGGVIPAITGGVFSFEITSTSSSTLLTSPAFILASYVIEQAIGSMTDPDDGSDWPLYVSYLPDDPIVKNNAGVFYDTVGFKDGRFMSGPVIQHYGVQIKIRSTTMTVGWAKIEAIVSALDAVLNDTIIIDSVEYLINNVKRVGITNPIGTEEGTKKRQLFTANLLLTLERVT